MASPFLARRAATLGLALALAAGWLPAGAAPKQVRLVVPFPPSGNLDTITRQVAEGLQQTFGVVIVENRPGANGNIGADNAYKSAPDGSTLMFAPYGPIAVNQHLYPRLSYDPAQWVPVAMLGTVPNVLAIHPSLPVHDLAGFIAYLRANPGKVAFASQGAGSSSHLAAELFMQLTGTSMLHIPYKGTGPALVDLLGGQVTVFFDTLSSSGKYQKSGKLRILAVADDKRSPLLPEVPTFAEAGPPSMTRMMANAWYAVVAPPKTPRDVVQKYERAINEVLASPATKRKFEEMGIDPLITTSAEAGRFMQQETEKWGQVIRAGKITLD
ncbi:tripartite tricarboxylate transporter substrate binding protein [Pigmentiphaga sp.]|uniref:Bug family tripartite tricarboxylate transporter substrate binding protein n=1 Tax=Pigmentiphaga sp. TaxID=1977564 RepID=UPI00128B0294|nr:tripartite tricarboxylate transporter substrate binding protein [Pigmentiphaga sp.]MPS26150.1 tripartite tricarboxylate transporter substrate binding protein [Alcaligenaceae bacterium SAGV5]MPS53185.1 tripartite tricarboxylate transporter substrate binding protein [Alcaligenaceae bacterium SAGV3]MPT55377.1 tripartite tricarboxylate transporter substrate binding protein [Alcaligenaceae bacterium]